MSPLKSKESWRVIMNDDAHNNFGGLTTADTICDRIDYIHEKGVDVLAWCTCFPDLCNYPTKIGEWAASPDRRVPSVNGNDWSILHNQRVLVEQGNDPIDVMAERCHHHGMVFIGSMRVNDIHHIHGYRHPSCINHYVLDHPDWCIRDADGRIIGGLDYAVADVREHRLAILQEQLELYDLDGLEMDFMRGAPFFQPGEERKGAAIMTDFVRQVRKIVGDKRYLGARVETTMDLCRAVGTDVDTWLTEGWLDYLCPSPHGFPDLNILTEQFVDAAKGSDCGIFPTMQCNGHAQYDREMVFTIEKYRGMGHNYFSFGAQGISTFNFMMGKIGTWHTKRHAGGWNMMREMHQPEALAKLERRYFYDHTLYPDRRLEIDRTKDVGKRKSIPFRIAEDFSDTSWHREMRFKPNDLSAADKVEFDINGESITDRLRSDFLFEMCDPPNSARYFLDLEGTAVRHGDNELGVTLIEANPYLQEWTPDYLGYTETLPITPIHFTEIEIVVKRAD